MAGYTIVDNFKIEPHITFIRIHPSDIALTLREVFISLSDLSWIASFDEDYIRYGFEIRANDTIEYIARNIIKEDDSNLTKHSGEYVVSELARKSIVETMDYLDVPLAELIKIKDIGNHGFDFYTKNKYNILLFGEAKYLSDRNAYGKAFKSIVEFENVKQDHSDLIDIDKFFCEESKANVYKGEKGFMAAFATKNTTTEQLIKSITKNKEFQALRKFREIICIAVNV